MNHNSSRIAALTGATQLALALLLFPQRTTDAQALQEVLDLGPGSSVTDVLVNPSPNEPWPAGIFLSAYTPDNGYAILSVDLTRNPAGVAGVADAFSLSNRKLTSCGNVLYEAGDTRPNSATAWHARRSTDGGESWTPIMTDWQLAPGKAASARGVAADATGRILVCGRAADSRGNFHPIIRRSLNGGTSWSTVLDGSKGANFDNVAGIQFVPDVTTKPGGIFAAGRVGNYWTVWRSADGGGTWPLVHYWQPKTGIAEATAIAHDSNGNVYVGGMGNRVNYPRNWYVWATFDGGRTWQDLGCPPLSGTDCILNDLEVDPIGAQLWAVGSQGQFNWRMQRWSAAGWTAPFYPYAGLASRAWGVAIDSVAGQFYVSGSVTDAAGQSHGTVLQINQ